jgi:hypothetical protein
LSRSRRYQVRASTRLRARTRTADSWQELIDAPSNITTAAAQMPESVKTVSSSVTLQHADTDTVNTATDSTVDRSAIT